MTSTNPEAAPSHASFPSTLWSDIVGDGDGAGNRERLERLLRSYWKPVFCYVRCAWRKSIEDSLDLTQGFFAHVLEKDFLGRARPDAGSFRGYLKHSLRNFVIDAARADAARGGGLRFDMNPAELARLEATSPDEPPERAFDREWFHRVLESATDALREWLHARGKSDHFETFRLYCLDAGDDPPTYESLAQRLGVGAGDVRHRLEYCRTLLRKLLKEKVREYAAGDADAESEFGELMRE